MASREEREVGRRHHVSGDDHDDERHPRQKLRIAGGKRRRDPKPSVGCLCEEMVKRLWRKGLWPRSRDLQQCVGDGKFGGERRRWELHDCGGDRTWMGVRMASLEFAD
ncbi:hypothetical protein V8G54_029493 [Vigna mungo]|uniref:Uncharacterized protein n=1 Tax=Vigna mungo TaxID=3915 RepID=A0AAQ3MUC6_VIGMU